MRLRALVGIVAAAAVLTAAAFALARGGALAVVAPKALVAGCALAASVYDGRRDRRGSPLPARLRRRVGVSLGLAALAAYYADARLSYDRFFHVWDQYHYFVGSKYFDELGYDALYRCSAVALAEGGATVTAIRDLGASNALVPAAPALAAPGECIRRFTPGRWAAFVADVRFFHRAAGPQGATLLQDHGYNPPPAWTLVGGSLAGLRPASTGWLQALAALDLVLVAGAFGALWWGFGWRTASLAAVVWGCQSLSIFYWTGGAFLRQDWFFLLLLAAALARRRRFAGAGAALGAAAMLRVFPVLFALGWLVAAGHRRLRAGRSGRTHLRLIAGFAASCATLFVAGGVGVGWEAYPAFARHTLQVHAATPLANQVGLGVLGAYRPGGPRSGRMRYTVDPAAGDPHASWKAARMEHARAARPWILVAAFAGLAGWAAAVRRRRAWSALCLGWIPVYLLLQLTSYYYSFLAVAAPLARVRRALEPVLIGFAGLSLLPPLLLRWNDDRYAALSVLAGALCVATLMLFLPRSVNARTVR